MISERKKKRWAMRREGQDVEKPWYDQPQTFVDPYQLKPPYDNVFVGPDPHDGMTKEYADQFDAIVNVSSTECATFEPSRPDQRTYWYPIIEMGRWSLGYLFWLKQVMDFHHEQGHKIYLHCHAGAFRSPSAACLWLQSRGHTDAEALDMGTYRGADSGLYGIQKNHGNIPKGKDALFDIMKKQTWPCIESICHYEMYDPWDHEIMSGKHRIDALLHHYFWFYFKPKWWVKTQWRAFKDWALKRQGWISEGCGTYYYTRAKFWSWGDHSEPMQTDNPGWNTVGDWKWDGKTWVRFRTWNSETHEWDAIP